MVINGHILISNRVLRMSIHNTAKHNRSDAYLIAVTLSPHLHLCLFTSIVSNSKHKAFHVKIIWC